MLRSLPDQGRVINGIAKLVEQVLGRSDRRTPQTARLIGAMMVGAAQLAISFCPAAMKGLDPHLIDEPRLIRRGATARQKRKPLDDN